MTHMQQLNRLILIQDLVQEAHEAHRGPAIQERQYRIMRHALAVLVELINMAQESEES